MIPIVTQTGKTKYDKWTREQLVVEVEQLRKRKKYGLVWENKPEDVVEQCKTELPVIKEIKDKAITVSADAPTNILIEGDNYHALSVLNYTHKEKIDVIYIDPPYNTGAKDWKYNNNFVDINDGYRHSKWLSMMNSRLVLAKKLLKPNGVLICTIDENEHATLGMLFQGLFPEKEIVCVTIVHNPGGIQGNNFSYCHEYAYFVYPKGGTFISDLKRDDVPLTPLRDWGKENSKREGAKNCFYPILVKNSSIVGFGDVSEDRYHPKSSNIKRKTGVIEVYPIDKKGVERKWRFSRQSVESITDELLCRVVNGEVVVYRDKKDFRWKTVWTDSKYNANVYGTKLVNNLVQTKFPFPKSLYAVQDCLRACIHPKDAIILDFFAGSGTTGHAVALLNKEDGGNRQFILCTNNENGIVQKVCYPRIKAVIHGHKDYRDITGIPSNLKYFRTAFVKAEPNDKNKEALTREATEMLCMREDTFELVKETKAVKIFGNGKRHTGIVFDEDAIPALKKDIAKIGGVWSVYIFSLGDDAFDEEFADMKKITVAPIPEAIMRVYRRIFQTT